jgi:hypothetical protein
MLSLGEGSVRRSWGWKMELNLEEVAVEGVNSTVAQWEVGGGIYVIRSLNQNSAVTETSVSRRIL